MLLKKKEKSKVFSTGTSIRGYGESCKEHDNRIKSVIRNTKYNASEMRTGPKYQRLKSKRIEKK